MPKPEFSVSVAVRHLPEQSDPQSGQHAFAYTISIVNSGDITAQLIGRHWIITDALGHTEEVRGLAVVGHQP
ncbi:MAG TPA: ApaG domain, partial [Burkholderiaceae bacterium]|nr:ApaG domain [Burkholderiaceae bacterium]